MAARREALREDRFCNTIGRWVATSLVMRRRPGAPAPNASERRRPMTASTVLATTPIVRMATQTGAQRGSSPTSVAAGSMTTAAANSRREVGTIIAVPAHRGGCDPGLRRRALPSISNSGRSIRRCSRTGDAMARTSSGVTKSRPCESRPCAAAREQRLGRARAGADQDAVVGARAPHDVDDILDEFLAHGDELQGIPQLRRSRARRDTARRRRAAALLPGACSLSMRRARSNSSSRSGAVIAIFSMKRSFCASGSG